LIARSIRAVHTKLLVRLGISRLFLVLPWQTKNNNYVQMAERTAKIPTELLIVDAIRHGSIHAMALSDVAEIGALFGSDKGARIAARQDEEVLAVENVRRPKAGIAVITVLLVKGIFILKNGFSRLFPPRH